MGTENTTAAAVAAPPAVDPRNAVIDGGAATEAEAALAAQPLDMSDVTEGNAGATDDAAALAAAEAAKVAAQPDPQALADAEAVRVANETREAAATAAAAAAAAKATAQPVYVPPELAKPEPPKDFAAEQKAAQEAYDAGDKTLEELNADLRKLNAEEANYQGKLGVWEANNSAREQAMQANQTAAAAAVEQDWNTAALAFQGQHQAFLAVPAQAQALQDAIAAIDASNQAKGISLAASELLDRAGKVVFPQFKYAPGVANTGKSAEELTREAIAARKPEDVGPTLANVPAAANVDLSGRDGYASLDGLDASDLEDAIARMTPSQRTAYLESSPGATTTGRE